MGKIREMLNAKTIRKLLKVPKKIKIRTLIKKYFEQELKKASAYIVNMKGPFGLSFTLRHVFEYFNTPQYIHCCKEELLHEFDEFIKELNNLGYYAVYKRNQNENTYESWIRRHRPSVRSHRQGPAPLPFQRLSPRPYPDPSTRPRPQKPPPGLCLLSHFRPRRSAGRSCL